MRGVAVLAKSSPGRAVLDMLDILAATLFDILHMNDPDVSGGRPMTLAAACLAMLAVRVNGTAVMAALPTLGRDLALGPVGLQWVVNAYLVASAVCIILGGKMADRFGAERISIAGIGVFALASTVIACAPWAPVVVAGRGLQGIGAALAVPASLAAVGAAAVPSRRPAAIGAWTGFVMLGFSIGPLVGGVMTHFLGWRTIFWLNVAIMLTALAGFLSDRRFAGAAFSASAGRSDRLGFVLLAVSMTCLVLGLQSLARHPIGALAAFAVAAAALGGLMTTERRKPEPLVDFGYFAHRNFTLGAAIGSIAMLGILTFLLYYNLFVQNGRGLRLTAVAAGVSLLPMSAAILGFALAAPALAARFGLRAAIGGGMASVIAAAVLIGMGTAGGSPILLGIGLVAMGAGLALPYACAPRLALAALSPAQAGQGSGMISACTFLGGSIGVAIGGLAYAAGGFVAVLAMLALVAIIGAALCRGIVAEDAKGSR
jgi:MFS family permease